MSKLLCDPLRLPAATLGNFALVSGQRWRTGHCAGCNHEYRPDEAPAGEGMLIEPEGVALYTLCSRCFARVRRERKFRRQLERDARRSIFKAGPDDVGGVA